jgi:ABC-2 type transport system ATP-binding protein
LIEVRNLVKRYNGHTAVDHLSFTVEKGQIYGFLGPNGAGKSTTMNIMTGYIGMTEGEVVIDGHNLAEEPLEARRCIGYLPEQPPLYNDMTVIEYLIFAAELKGLNKDTMAEEIEKVVKLTRLEDMASRLIKNLSKGYRQRVGLAQAILGFPDVIILDEPTVGLDPQQIIEIRELIRSLAGRHTVILSSHILSEVQEICDHIMIIHHGRLVASGTPEELERTLRTPAVEITVRADSADRVQSAFKKVSGVTEVVCHGLRTPGEINARLETVPDADIRQEIFDICVAENMPLLMLRPADISLEQIFLQVTSDQTATVPAEKEVHA